MFSRMRTFNGWCRVWNLRWLQAVFNVVMSVTLKISSRSFNTQRWRRFPRSLPLLLVLSNKTLFRKMNHYFPEKTSMACTYVDVVVYVPLPSLTLMLQQVIVMRSFALESTRVWRDSFRVHKARVSTYIHKISNVTAQTRRCHWIIIAASILHNFIIQEDGANDFQKISKFSMKTKAIRMEMRTTMDYFFRQQIINNFLIFYT